MKTGSIFPILVAQILFAGGAIGASVGNGATDENGLIPYVWWKFDGDTTEHGSFATEAAIAGTYVVSQGGFALKHTGNGWGSGIGTEDDWGDWTLTVVARVTSVDNGIIFGLGSRNANDGAKTRGIALASGGADKVTVSPFFGTAAHSDLIEAEVENASDAYHFYAVTFVGSTKTVALYVDGELKHSVKLESEVNPVEGHWQFGSIHGNVNDTGLSEQKNQFFDDVRFYRTALTDVQIAAIAAAFPAWTGAKTIAEGETWTLEKDESLATLSVGAGATIDLNGYDLRIGSVPDNSFSADKLYIVTNSNDETTGTVTLGVGNGTLGFNKNAILGGNLRYVMVGTNQTHFRQNNEKRDDALVANTHTGGTVISNTTSQLRFYSPDNFGTGPIILCNASLMRPSSYLGDLNFKNPWEFYGSNSMELQHYSGNGASINLKGPWSGDGTIHIQNGFIPTIELNGDMADFTGVLEIAYKDGTGGFWMRGDNTNGLPNATLRIANVGDDATKHFTHLKIKPGNNATIAHESNITAFPIGHLVTDGDNPEEFVNSYIMNCQQWASSTWEIGALNESGTFAGWFSQETANAHLAIKKVGTGTWTLTSSLHTFDGPLTVSAGRLNINSANLTNCAVVVKSGATLGGTGTLSEKCAVTVESGAVLAGSLTLSAGLTLESGAIFGCDTATTVSVPGDIDLSGARASFQCNTGRFCLEWLAC